MTSQTLSPGPRAGRNLLLVAALATMIVPIVTDAVIAYPQHMGIPLDIPHAKLHISMSFMAAFAMGLAATVTVLRRPVTDRFAMGTAAFLGGAFWAGLILSRLWPGTSYGFGGQAGSPEPPVVLGVPFYPNVAMALAFIVVAALGYRLTRTAALPTGSPVSHRGYR
ncbi:hypothetical protein Asp14428_23250 [Actinoplanes sp. NBRC 14428]|uniref:Uncharacterized protein n=1 Tax=Pseudosporangium ferrugineum TaxID=439699 RepID=A0A2T0S8X4_9ACTN|nr:hypothetical protein [Pseudosporangium ferrugineum]PRY29879.1 hypothetical protein CLV70_10547 [Pseudosporangium ferrugineum]BCJ50850.1 hypothetical protein Asp14428_23250 [Actinoplanes sp. NBRC 14428]